MENTCKIECVQYLTGKTVYLTGNIHVTTNNDYGMGWRDKITPLLQKKYSLNVLDPSKLGIVNMAKEQQYYCDLIKSRDFTKVKKEFYKIVRKDLKAVDKSDFIIFNHNPNLPTIGSMHELVNSTNQKKPSLIMCEEQYVDKLNPWLLTMIKPQWLFTDWISMFNYLDNIHKTGIVETSHWW